MTTLKTKLKAIIWGNEFFRGLVYALAPVILFSSIFIGLWFFSLPFDIIIETLTNTVGKCRPSSYYYPLWQMAALLGSLAHSVPLTIIFTDFSCTSSITVDYLYTLLVVGERLLYWLFIAGCDLLDFILTIIGLPPIQFGRVIDQTGVVTDFREAFRFQGAEPFQRRWCNAFGNAFFAHMEETHGPWAWFDWRDTITVVSKPILPQRAPPVMYDSPLDALARKFFTKYSPLCSDNPEKYKDWSLYKFKGEVDSTDWYLFWNYVYLKHVAGTHKTWSMDNLLKMGPSMTTPEAKNAFRRWYFYAFEYLQLYWNVEKFDQLPTAHEAETFFNVSGRWEASYREWYYFNFHRAPKRWHCPVFPTPLNLIREAMVPWDRKHFLIWYYFNSPEVRTNPDERIAMEHIGEDWFIPVDKLIEVLTVEQRRFVKLNQWIATQWYWEYRTFERNFDGTNVVYLPGEPKPKPSYVVPRTEYFKFDFADWFQWNATLLTDWGPDAQFWYRPMRIVENDLGTFEEMVYGLTEIPAIQPINLGRLSSRVYNAILKYWTEIRIGPQRELWVDIHFYPRSKDFEWYLNRHFKEFPAIKVNLLTYEDNVKSPLTLLLSLKKDDQFFFWARYYRHFIDSRTEGFAQECWLKSFHLREDIEQQYRYPLLTGDSAYFKAWYFANIVDSTRYLKPMGRVGPWSEIRSKYMSEYYWMHYLRWEFFNFRWSMQQVFQLKEPFPLTLKEIRNTKTPFDEFIFLTWYFFNFVTNAGSESPILFSPTLVFRTATAKDMWHLWVWLERLLFTNYNDFGRWKSYENPLQGSSVVMLLDECDINLKARGVAPNHFRFSTYERIVSGGGGSMGETDLALRLSGPEQFPTEPWLRKYRGYAWRHSTRRTAPDFFALVTPEYYKVRSFNDWPWAQEDTTPLWFGKWFSGSKTAFDLLTSPRVHPKTPLVESDYDFVPLLEKYGVDPNLLTFSDKPFLKWTPAPRPRVEVGKLSPNVCLDV